MKEIGFHKVEKRGGLWGWFQEIPGTQSKFVSYNGMNTKKSALERRLQEIKKYETAGYKVVYEGVGMKNLIKSPSVFMEEIKARLDAKVTNLVESVAYTVADSVFLETKDLSTDTIKDQVDKDNVDIKLGANQKDTKRKDSIKRMNAADKAIGDGDAIKESDNWIQKAVPAKNKGKFSAKAKAAGMSTQEYAQQEKHAKGKLGDEARFALNMKKMSEDQLNELSMNTLKNYSKKVLTKELPKLHKAKNDLKDRNNYWKDAGYKRNDFLTSGIKTTGKNIKKREAGLDMALDKINRKNNISEDEELNELNNKGVYHVKKDGNVIFSGSHKNAVDHYNKNPGSSMFHDKIKDYMMGKESAKSAIKRINEDEELNELSKETLGSYVKKSKNSLLGNVDDGAIRRRINRVNGIDKAVDKLTNEDVGARNIYTKNKKTGENVRTFVVNKKRTSKADKDRRWKDLISKHKVDD